MTSPFISSEAGLECVAYHGLDPDWLVLIEVVIQSHAMILGLTHILGQPMKDVVDALRVLLKF